MKQKEKEIVSYLRQGKRVNISEIARELKLPISTVSDRIKRIEEKYILKRSSLLDYNKAGYFVNAFLAMKVSSSKKQALLDFLKKQPCVNSIFIVNSGFNLLIEVVFKENIGLLNWIEQMKSRFKIEILLLQVLKVEEKEVFVPD